MQSLLHISCICCCFHDTDSPVHVDQTLQKYFKNQMLCDPTCDYIKILIVLWLLSSSLVLCIAQSVLYGQI